MKKILASFLTIVLSLLMILPLAGCVGETETTGEQEEGDVVMAFLHAGTPQVSTGKVEAAVSAYVRSKLGFGIVFKQLNVYDQTTVYTNWLVAGEEIDLLNVAFTDPSLYINEKRVREISSLITEENTPYLFAELDRHPDSQLLGIDGNLYGIGVWVENVYGGNSYTIRKDVLEAAGLYGEGEGQYTHLQQITYSDLDTIFAAVKRVMPTTDQGLTVYPCSALSNKQSYSGFAPYDPMGTGMYPLAVMMMDPETGEFTDEVVNYYKTDEYKEFVEWMGNAFEQGYVHPDAAITSEWVADIYRREQYVGVVLATDAAIRYSWEEDHGEMIQLQLSVPYRVISSPVLALMIPSRSDRPNRTMQFVDLLYSDPFLANLLQYGVEGEEWTFADEEHGLIWEASEGSHKNYTIGGFWGDHGMMYQYVSTDVDLEATIATIEGGRAEKSACYEIAVTHTSPAAGFVYDTTAQSTRIRNIEANVLSKYLVTLNVGAGSKGTDGTYTGPGSTYAKFIEALDKAKIDLVVQDKQAQYDAWKEKQEG